MSENPKEIVRQTYNQIAQWYLEWVQGQSSPRERYTNKVLDNAPSSPHILELGCGAGIPITRMLLDRGAKVTANDISERQIEMAKERCPEATFIPGDMLALSFPPETFDGVVSYFAVFHLPRVEQKAMLTKLYSWLKPGGAFAFNLATMDEEEIHGEFLGHGMFWSSYDVEGSGEMVRAAGFEEVEMEVLEAGDGELEEGDPDFGVKFLWVLARKEGGEGREGEKPGKAD
ncbi:methyltransferase type 11 [Westerdykella ornata]|uniref:Methyltransferase type 11 n=1 Tax=Westerdykella ornata TaxID=318751 RepID=A0A6A6JBL6_WESOR|nr:methyltransferase type 11 [Westerdykella ornata]KAF2273685.1 methyltransferase type 11 [Westerdykella ornata]